MASADRRERVALPYVVEADGARSPVRERLGIGRSGRGTVGDPVVSVYFRTDLSGVVRGREFNLCQIQHPDGPGSLATVDGRARWVFMAAGSDTGRDWPQVLLRTALGDAGRARSTVDLAVPGWALLVAGDPARWERDAASAPVPLPVHRLDPDFLLAGTALLLRPDQVVAWRGEDPAAPAHVLRTLLAGAPSPAEVS